MFMFNLDSIGTALLSLSILTFFEIVLGVDNLVFLSLVTNRLPQHQQKFARRLGLTIALFTRLLFLAGIFVLIKFTTPLLNLAHFSLSGRDLLLMAGGFFLLYKSAQEIFLEMQTHAIQLKQNTSQISLFRTIVQIVFLDIVFSLDSLFTAIGMTQNFWIIATSIWLSILAMLFASEILSEFIHKHPRVKMLALSFLLMIGGVLIIDGLHFEIPKGYVYFAVCFSLGVEILNIMVKKKKNLSY